MSSSSFASDRRQKAVKRKSVIVFIQPGIRLCLCLLDFCKKAHTVSTCELHHGWVVRKPIKANLRLKVNRGFQLAH